MKSNRLNVCFALLSLADSQLQDRPDSDTVPVHA